MSASMIWTVRIEGRHQPFLEIPHTGPASIYALELAIEGCRRAGLVAIVNFTRTKKQVNPCPTTSSA